MFRKSFAILQFRRQFWRDTIAYSSGFGRGNQLPVSDYELTMAVYSPAQSSMGNARRKWPRNKQYTQKIRLLSSMARDNIS